MKPLIPQELPKFAKQYKFAGGQLLRVRQQYRKGNLTLDIILRVRPTIKNLDDNPRPVKLHLQLIGVDEMRYQKRPGQAAGKIHDGHFGTFDGNIYLTFDSWSLLPNERPGLHDFRGTDLYFGCRELFWEELPPKPASST
jgi:hypothetical protein